MATFREYLNEAKIETDEELISSLESSFKKQFPHGWIDVKKKSGLGDTDFISISLGIVPQNEASHGITQNDPGYHSFLIHIEDAGYDIDKGQGKLYIEPEEGSYMAMGSVKTKFRKAKGSADKVFKTFDRWFVKYRGLVSDNADNIYRSQRYDPKYFK